MTLEVQRKGVCACITRDFKVGASNLWTAESVYLIGPNSCTCSHSPHVQEKEFGDPPLPHLRSEWLDEAAPKSQPQGWDGDPGLHQSERPNPLGPSDWLRGGHVAQSLSVRFRRLPLTWKRGRSLLPAGPEPALLPPRPHPYRLMESLEGFKEHLSEPGVIRLEKSVSWAQAKGWGLG